MMNKLLDKIIDGKLGILLLCILCVCALCGCTRTDDREKETTPNKQTAHENEMETKTEPHEIVDETKTEGQTDAKAEDTRIYMTWYGEEELVLKIREDVVNTAIERNAALCILDEDDATQIASIEFYADNREADYGGFFSCTLFYDNYDTRACGKRENTVIQDGWYTIYMNNEEDIDIRLSDGSGYGRTDSKVPSVNSAKKFYSYMTPVGQDKYERAYFDDTNLVFLDGKADIGSLGIGKPSGFDELPEDFLTKEELADLEDEKSRFVLAKFILPEVTGYNYQIIDHYNADGSLKYKGYEIKNSYHVPVRGLLMYTLDDNGQVKDTGGKLIFPTVMDAISVYPKLFGWDWEENSKVVNYESNINNCFSENFHRRVSLDWLTGEMMADVEIKENIIYFKYQSAAENKMFSYVDVNGFMNKDGKLCNLYEALDINTPGSRTTNIDLEYNYTETFDFKGTVQLDNSVKTKSVVVDCYVTK